MRSRLMRFVLDRPEARESISRYPEPNFSQQQMSGLVAFNEECARATPHGECALTPFFHNETAVRLFIVKRPSQVGQFDGSNGTIVGKPNPNISQWSGPSL